MKAAAAVTEASVRWYKDYPIYATGVASHGGGWNPRGLAFDPNAETATEIKRLEASEVSCDTKREAEEQAVMLCRSWIDGLGKMWTSTL